VTVDHQTLEDGTVTVRHRDTMAQERIKIEALRAMVDDEVSFRKLFKKIKEA
jgi:glycyl-tRNA synthetase